MSVLLAFVQATALAEPVEFPGKDTGLTVVVDSRAKDPLYTSSVRIDIGPTSLNELVDIKIGLMDKENILLDAKRTVIIQVLVPSSIKQEERDSFLQAVKKMAASANYAGNVVVKEVVLNVAEVQQSMDRANLDLAAAADELSPSQVEEREIAKTMITQNRNLGTLIKSWEASFRQRIRDALADYDNKSMAFGSLAGTASSVAPVYIWLTST